MLVERVQRLDAGDALAQQPLVRSRRPAHPHLDDVGGHHLQLQGAAVDLLRRDLHGRDPAGALQCGVGAVAYVANHRHGSVARRPRQWRQHGGDLRRQGRAIGPGEADAVELEAQRRLVERAGRLGEGGAAVDLDARLRLRIGHRRRHFLPRRQAPSGRRPRLPSPPPQPRPSRTRTSTVSSVPPKVQPAALARWRRPAMVNRQPSKRFRQSAVPFRNPPARGSPAALGSSERMPAISIANAASRGLSSAGKPVGISERRNVGPPAPTIRSDRAQLHHRLHPR